MGAIFCIGRDHWTQAILERRLAGAHVVDAIFMKWLRINFPMTVC